MKSNSHVRGVKLITAAVAFVLLLVAVPAHGQAGAEGRGGAARRDEERREGRPAAKAFSEGNDLMEARKYAEALARYQEGLSHLPDDSSLLSHASTPALLAGDSHAAAPCLKRLVTQDVNDWQSRAKLIQTYQALGELKARDAERAVLFDLRQRGGGENKEKRDVARTSGGLLPRALRSRGQEGD